jgi:acyl carrier protein
MRVRGSKQDSEYEMYAMQPTELIRQFLNERLGVAPETVVDEALLSNLGVDSLMLAELMFEAEDRLGISIHSSIDAPRTVGDMVTLIETLLADKATKAAQA